MGLSLSNAFIVISAIFTFFSLQDNEFRIFGMNHFFLLQWDYIKLVLQFCFYSFLHGWFFHLLFNSFFLYIFWNQVEWYIGRKWYMIFFVFVTILNGISLLILTQIGTNTIGISGFALAILSFYTLLLYQAKNPEYKGGITALVINIFIGLSAQISFVGHLFGAIFWGVFYLIYVFISRRR